MKINALQTAALLVHFTTIVTAAPATVQPASSLQLNGNATDSLWLANRNVTAGPYSDDGPVPPPTPFPHYILHSDIIITFTSTVRSANIEQTIRGREDFMDALREASSRPPDERLSATQADKSWAWGDSSLTNAAKFKLLAEPDLTWGTFADVIYFLIEYSKLYPQYDFELKMVDFGTGRYLGMVELIFWD